MIIGKASWVAALVLLALGGFFLGFSGSVDDAHITFWAAQSLAMHGEMLNYNFERVEQSSALLQVLLLALLHSVSNISIVALGHIVTVLAAIATLFYTGKVAQCISPTLASATFSTFTTLLLLATCPFFVYWTFSGMEGPLLALLLVLLLLFLDGWLQERKLLAMVCLISLATQMTRPEMPVVLCVFALILFPARAVLKVSVWRWKSLALFLLIQILCAGLLIAWRGWYFGDIAPQPVNAKIGGAFFSSLLQGLQYAQQTLFDPRLLLFTALTAISALWVLLRWREPLAVMLALLLFVYSAFVVASGGDWMAAGRFWVPVVPLMAVLVSVFLYRLCASRVLRNSLLCLIVVGNMLYLWRGTAIDFNGVPLWKKTKLIDVDHADNFSFFELHAREHLHDIPTIAYVKPLVEKLLSLRTVQGNLTPVNIMAGQMGMLPFYLAQDFGKQLRFFDRNGITERTLTHCSAAMQLPRTRNGIGTGYEWIIKNKAELESHCGLAMPDIVFDIETGWNRHNIAALEQAGYVFVYRQRGHIFAEPQDALLPLRKIGAGQFIAVSDSVWQQLGRPVPVERFF
jgi:hypothetical protein